MSGRLASQEESELWSILVTFSHTFDEAPEGQEAVDEPLSSSAVL